MATVSRVLNSSGPVRDETRDRVEGAAAELRYSPNGAARSLITRRTDVFGVILPELHGEFFSEVIRGMDPQAQRHGYHLLLSSSRDGKREIEFALRAMRGRVDGLVVMSPTVTASALAASLPAHVPVVLLNCDTAGSPYDSIRVDNFGGARAMVHHLAAMGHERIAMVAGSEANFDARERLRGYRAALAEAGLPEEDRVVEGDFTEAAGYRAAVALARRSPRPTAVFCANDSMAVGVLSGLRAAGLRVPDDVAVAGFDDIPIARYLSPPLSSVHVDVHRLGARAVELLCHALDKENREAPIQELFPTRLVTRRSCGGPGPGDDAAPPPPEPAGAPATRSQP